MVCLGLYKYKVVKVTEQFKSVVVAATLAIATYYIILGYFRCLQVLSLYIMVTL
jgi:uncharacterized YccA/Bax inhibitor family protein